MSFSTSAYNRPENQHDRLSFLRLGYDNRKSSIKEELRDRFIVAFFLLVVALLFYIVDWWPPYIFCLFVAFALIAVPLFELMMLWQSPPHDYLICPYCKDRMSVTAGWTCGHCGRENTPDFKRSGHPTFAEGCSRCNLTPHSLSCGRCGKPIVFKPYKFEKSPDEIAFLTGSPPALAESADTLDKRRERIKKKWQ